MEHLQTTLVAEELTRWRFNGLMDFKKPARQPADCVAHWEPIIAEAHRIWEERKAAAAALLQPAITVVWHIEDPAARAADLERSRAEARRRIAAENAAFAQMTHIGKLKTQYSYELAHSLWWIREDRRRAIGDHVRQVYRETYEAEWAAQEAFENEQADAAIAALVAANPHLPEKTVAFLRRHLKYRLHLFFRREPRSAAPRRVLRGVPPVLCGSLPSQARLEYPPEHNALIDRAF
jgi:hypothetical protein